MFHVVSTSDTTALQICLSIRTVDVWCTTKKNTAPSCLHADDGSVVRGFSRYPVKPTVLLTVDPALKFHKKTTHHSLPPIETAPVAQGARRLCRISRWFETMPDVRHPMCQLNPMIILKPPTGLPSLDQPSKFWSKLAEPHIFHINTENYLIC